MYIVKKCRSCGKQLRFPVDKGKVKITCLCGESFIADPDDPVLFKNASFDLGNGRTQFSFGKYLNRRYLNLKIDEAVQALYDFRYRVQNFPLLPWRERFQVLGVLAVIILIIVIIILSMFHPYRGSNGSAL